MKKLAMACVLMVTLAGLAGAHGNNDHVRGVVKELSATSVTVEVSGQGQKTLSLTPKTTFEKSGKPAHLADLKVGDRVIIDVPKGTTEAHEIRFGATPKKSE